MVTLAELVQVASGEEDAGSPLAAEGYGFRRRLSQGNGGGKGPAGPRASLLGHQLSSAGFIPLASGYVARFVGPDGSAALGQCADLGAAIWSDGRGGPYGHGRAVGPYEPGKAPGTRVRPVTVGSP